MRLKGDRKMIILIVDDSIFMQNIVKATLTKNFPDATLITAINGEEGLNLYKTNKPNYIITDLLMPGMNGIELVKTIRSSDSKVKIIIISADIQKTVKDEIEKLKVSAFINKPFKEEKIFQLIDTIRSGK